MIIDYTIPTPEKVTELEAIYFPPPLIGSVTLKRVQVTSRMNDEDESPRYYYVRVYIRGNHYRIACTTHEAAACRFADMALQRFAKYALKKPRWDFNYSLAQVLKDIEEVPKAVALLDKLEAQYKPSDIRTFTIEERLTRLESKLLGNSE